jgi:predicted CXXCH cytochrome family protein
MRWLIRRVLKRATGDVFEDDIHFGDTLGIGRGTDQAIYITDLRAALQHARVTALGGGRYRIESLIAAGVRVDGASEQNTTVKSGSCIDIGATRIKLIDPPDGYEAAVEISAIDEAQADAARTPPTLTLSDTGLAMRAWSWALFLLALVVGLGLPLAAHYAPPVRDVLESVPLGGRKLWNTGELASAHHFFGDDCQQCHRGAFVSVRDEQCLACHAQTAAHVDAGFDLTPAGDDRCAYCHRDHNGEDALVRADQTLCSDCHDGITSRIAAADKHADVADFGRKHDAFVVSLPQWDAQGNFAPVRAALTTPGIKEQSGLNFPHDLHLDAEGIRAASGERRVLDCASCHQPEPGGARMLPIDFEQHCQGCHRLSFSIRDADREVPHASVEKVGYTINEFFAREALEGGFNQVNAPTVVRARRRPGQPITAQERAEALSWAREQARTAIDRLYEDKACSTCHRVSRGVEGEWRVAPVRIAGAWFPKARFDHGSHRTLQCVDCHNAANASSSEALLLPDIDNCRQCHGGEHARDLVPTTCIDCHAFHDAANPGR